MDRPPCGDLDPDGQTDGEHIQCFLDLPAGVLFGDPVHIAHSEHNANNVLDRDDAASFVSA